VRASACLLATVLATLTRGPSRAQDDATSPAADADWVAPARYEHVVGRVGGRTGKVIANLRYEGNNRSIRGDFDPDPADGCRNADRYRALARRTRGLFVLRDALFSQQDHPTAHRGCALMMPANWVTAAVDDTLAGRPLRPLAPPATDDDAAWAAVATAADLFGSFPPSDALFEWATRARAVATPDDVARIANARANVRQLARHADYLLAAAGRGAAAVAEAGAECIAASDRDYFTPDLRRDKIIVLGVEHPNEHEIRDENKGIAIWNRTVDARALSLTRDAIYRRRLADGPIAIERYDLNLPAERRRVIEVLQMLVPRDSKGHEVYVWVGGPLPEGSERAEDASHLLPTFEAELAAADLARDRVVVDNRPSFRMKGHTAADFDAAVDAFAAAGRPLSVNLSPRALHDLMAPPGE
jgi:hypothetical protein